MRKRFFLVGMLVFLSLIPLFSGDIASFVNLGFSEDSSVFMFGQYGILNGSQQPYAGIYAVDVKNNRFVRDGVFEKLFTDEIEAGQDGSGALYKLLHEAAPIIKTHKVDHLSTGRLVYILIDGDKPKDRIEFRDFVRGDSYVLTLVQQKFGTGKDVSASFHINLSVTPRSGKTRAYTLGIPDYRREQVLSYRIKGVYFTPAEDGLVVVVEKEMWDEEGRNIRYMVETTPLGG
jgi:predicted secreted protein